MVTDALNDLIALSDELASVTGRPPTSPRPLPEYTSVHPDIVEVLCSRVWALRQLGIDFDRIDEYTERARSQGMRRKLQILGWHPDGSTWFATPMRHADKPKLILLHRLERLRQSEITVADLVRQCIVLTEDALVEARKPPAEEAPAPPAPPVAQLPPVDAGALPPPSRSMRLARVDLPDSEGATVIAGGDRHELSGPDLAYIRWCLDTLQLLSHEPTPDLTRWEARALRACRLDAVPSASDPAHPAFLETLTRLTRRDRSAGAAESHQIPSWKLAAPGHWIFGDNEIASLRRAGPATPPRHRPSPEQAEIWSRWVAMVQADTVELDVH